MGYLLNVIYCFAILISLPWLIVRTIRTGRYRTGWKERFLGLVPPSVAEDAADVVWLHAVSVGELQLLRTLIAGIEKRFPDCHLCISTTTTAAMTIAKSSFAEYPIFTMPLDFTWSVRTAMRRIRPKILILVELEVWPNLIQAAKEFDCFVVVVNGRLSQRSFEGYRRFRGLIQSTFAKLDLVAAQDSVYASRFRELGVIDKRLLTVGNLKFDGACGDRSHPEVLSRKSQLRLKATDLVWVVGSTQSPEEEYVLDAFRKLRISFPNCKLILVPRQPDRFDELARWLEASEFRMVRRSQATELEAIEWDILLGDTVGELRWWWGLAGLAFVGGSFGDRGGQNMIEPAAFGVSTAIGPNTKNFSDTVRILVEANAITQLENPSQLLDWALANLASESHRTEIGLRARATAAAHRGALDRTLEALAPLLG